MLRDGATLRFALLMPAFQLVLFGLIDTNVRHVPTVVFDQSRTQESAPLIDELRATPASSTSSATSLRATSSARGDRRRPRPGRASRSRPTSRAAGSTARAADVLVLIDGSDSSIASQTLSAATGLALSRSLDELMRAAGMSEPPLDAAPGDALQPGLAQRQPPHPGPGGDPAHLLRHAPRGLLDRPRARARHARAAHGDAGLAVRASSSASSCRTWCSPSSSSLLVLVLMTDGLPRADPRQPAAPARALGRLPRWRSCRSACWSRRAPAPRWRRSSSRRWSCCRRSCSRATSSRSRRCRRRSCSGVADPAGDPLHRHLARHHPRAAPLLRPLGARRRAGRDLHRPRPRLQPGVQKDHSLTANGRRKTIR